MLDDTSAIRQYILGNAPTHVIYLRVKKTCNKWTFLSVFVLETAEHQVAKKMFTLDDECYQHPKMEAEFGVPDSPD